MSDLDRLREIGQLVRPPSFDELLDTRRRRTLRTRIAAASTLAVAAIATAGVLATTGHSVRTGPPPVSPPSTPRPTTTTTEPLEIPAGQQTITPDISPGDVHGFEVLATLTNSQPQHQDDSELSTTVTVHTDGDPIVAYCRGTSDLWYVYDKGDGGGGMDHCSPDADADTALANSFDIPESTYAQDAEPMTVRMWIVRPSTAWIACLSSSIGDCNAEYGTPAPISDPGAEFGFRIYEHQEARSVLEILEDPYGNGPGYVFEALSSIDGDAWLVNRAVTPAPDARRLAFELPASESERLVDVYTVDGPHLERCAEQHKDELPDDFYFLDDPALDEFCGVTLRLVIDGDAVTPDRNPYAQGHFTELGARLTPGTVHQVEVAITHGDPRNIRYAVVVRTRTQLR